MTPAQPGLGDEIEPGAIERAAAGGVVETAKRDGRFMRLALCVDVEESLSDRRGEAAPFGPHRHRSRLLRVDEGRIGQDRRALGRRRDDVIVLEEEMKIAGAIVRKQAEREEEGLAEMAKANQPQTRRQVMESGSAPLSRFAQGFQRGGFLIRSPGVILGMGHGGEISGCGDA
jgi:hypothetical protein